MSSPGVGGSGKGNKRKRNEFNMGDALPLARPELLEFNLTSTRPESRDNKSLTGNSHEAKDEKDEWQLMENGRPSKKAKKVPKRDSSNYPEIAFSKDARLQTQVKIGDLQNLVLYILADGTSPQFVSVRHRAEIRKVVVLMVPGLERDMFDEEGSESSKQRDRSDYTSPDSYYPELLKSGTLPQCLKPFADMFDYMWPVKTPGDDRFAKMHSPLQAMLTAPLLKTKEEKKQEKSRGKGAHNARDPPGWVNRRTPITAFIQTPEELLENDYIVHPAAYNNEDHKIALEEHRQFTGVSKDHGWVDTLVSSYEDGTVPDNEIKTGSLTGGREILAMDCEMCKTGETEFSLTRVSIVGWDGTTILDELVKPEKPIIDYLTMYSGITEKILENVNTTLADIQQKLLKILNPRTILIGHSLNSDLTALKLTHPFIIDTAIAYPHPRGPPLKSSLKWLAMRNLKREIQKGHGTTGPGAGHDSIEDARTCLDLMKLKCEKGPDWGTDGATGESIFKRVSRLGVRYKNQGGSAVPDPINSKTSAAVDWGDPKKGAGSAATYVIGCRDDSDVVKGIIRAVKGDPDGAEIPGKGVDFVWGRLRQLEALKGWWNNNKIIATDAATEVKVQAEVVSETAPAIDTDKQTIVPGEEALASEDTKDSRKQDTIVAPKELVTDSSTETVTAGTLEDKLAAIETARITNNPRCNALRPPPPLITPIPTAVATLSSQIAEIYDALPPCTALIVYSGSGDPREMSRLQTMQATFKREYKIKKWDQLSVKWTDTEEQALKRAVNEARQGIAFICVK